MVYGDAMFTPTAPASSIDPHTNTNTNTNTNPTNPRRTPFDAILVNATPDATPPSSTNPMRTLSAKCELTLSEGSRLLNSMSSVGGGGGGGGGGVKTAGEGRPKPPPSLKDRRMQGLGGSAVRLRFLSFLVTIVVFVPTMVVFVVAYLWAALLTLWRWSG